MHDIVSAIYIGAKADLNRQYITIGFTCVDVLILISYVCSLLVGLCYLIRVTLSGLAGH